MKWFYLIIFLYTFSIGCQNKDTLGNHIFYLHGRIIELQGIHAEHEQYCKYEYESILDSLEVGGNIVYAEIRNDGTDFEAFCVHISEQIDSLIRAGVEPKRITVIGASKGAVMAMNISDMNQNPINYILLGANNEFIEQENDWNLNGRVLGIYERSDAIAGKSYDIWITRSTNAIEFEQLEINAGLGHGFLYRPINDWLEPAKDWLKY